MKFTSAFVALGAFLGLNPANGFNLRSRSSLKRDDGEGKPKIKTPKEIHEKWDGLSEVLEILFEVACRSKHQKDTHGEAVFHMRKDKLTQEEFTKKKIDVMADNVVAMKQGCGFAVAKGEQKCRESCAERWGPVQKSRSECDDACVAQYATFEKRCASKTEDLAAVYKMEQKRVENQNRCLETHCKPFPTTYTMDDEKDQKKEVKKRCKDYCSEKLIKIRCEQQFALSGDGVAAKVASKCSEEGTIPDCVKDSAKKVGGKKDDCQKDGEGDCDKDASDCEGKGDQGKEFCASRKTQCLEKVTASCTKDHKKALAAGKKKCEDEGGEEYIKCKEEKFKKESEKAVKKCSGEKKEKCPDKCKASCEVEKMNKCLKKFEIDPDNDPSQMFCEQTWKTLESGSEIDEATGNRVALDAQVIAINRRLVEEEVAKDHQVIIDSQ